jgi:hypothetical protein
MSTNPAPRISATLKTKHCTITAFGNNKPEAYMTLHHAWQLYANRFDVAPTLVDLYRFSIKYNTVSAPYESGTALVDNVPFIQNALASFPSVLYHVNRRGQVYFLHNPGQKDGTPIFTFSMNLSGQLADKLPNGHEVYEAPNGMVFVRPIINSLIKNDEEKVIKRLLKINFRPEAYRAELKKQSVVIHLASEIDVERLLRGSLSIQDIEYHTAFKFDLVTNKTGNRKFIIRLLRNHDNKWLPYKEIKNLHAEAATTISELATEINDGLLHNINQPSLPK